MSDSYGADQKSSPRSSAEVLEEVRKELKAMNALRHKDKKDVRVIREEQEYREELESIIGFILACMVLIGFVVYVLANELVHLKRLVMAQERTVASPAPMRHQQNQQQNQRQDQKQEPVYRKWILITDLSDV